MPFRLVSVSAVIDRGMITISEGRKQKRDRDTGLCRQKEVSHVETVSQSGAPGKSGRAGVAIKFRGLRLRNRSSCCLEKRKGPRRGISGGVWDWTEQPYA